MDRAPLIDFLNVARVQYRAEVEKWDTAAKSFVPGSTYAAGHAVKSAANDRMASWIIPELRNTIETFRDERLIGGVMNKIGQIITTLSTPTDGTIWPIAAETLRLFGPFLRELGERMYTMTFDAPAGEVTR